MASTYAPSAAFNYAKTFIQNAYLDQLSPQILDDVNKIFWMYAPWRWTLGVMPVVSLVANTQDYNVTIPSDFLFLHKIQMFDGKNTRDIKTAAYLPLLTGNVHQGQVQEIAVQTIADTTTGYRLNPVPGTFPTNAATQQLVSLYKKQAPTITSGNSSTPGVLQIPDEFFWVYEEGVVYKAMYWALDARAGDAKLQGNQVVYSGQLAKFMDGLNQVREMEKLNVVDKQQEDKP